MVIARIASGVVNHFASRIAEWILTAAMLGFAQTLLSYHNTFSTSVSYNTMADYGSECMWGVMLGTVALPRLLALILNGSVGWFKRWSPWCRTVCAFLSGLSWLILAMGFYAANPASTGAKTYFFLFIGDALLAFLIAKEVGVTERRVRNARAGT